MIDPRMPNPMGTKNPDTKVQECSSDAAAASDPAGGLGRLFVYIIK
jgi:hypothetical protein